MRIAAIMAILLSLTGCEAIRDVQLFPKVSQANAQMARAKIACDAQFPPQIGNYLPHAKCIDAAQNWVIRPLMPYPDLLARSQTNREALAAQVDRGLLDPGALGRLTDPEDAPVTLADTTLNGPLSRSIGSTYYAPLPQKISGTCSSGYSFTDCSN